MFSPSPRKFHSLLIAPALLPFLFLISPSARNNYPPAHGSSSYTVHGTLYGSFPFSDPIYLVSNGSVSHGDLRTFGRFNGYSQDSFIYDPNYGYVGADSFTYHACDSSNNCVDGTISLNVVNNPPVPPPNEFTTRVNQALYVGGPDALSVHGSDPDHDPVRVTSYTQTTHGTVTYTYSSDSLVYSPN